MKRYHVYRMNFGSEWLRRSAMCMGMSIFLLAAYYLGMHDLAEFTGGHLFLNLWLPLVLAIGFVVLLCVVKWDAPGLYAIVCAVFKLKCKGFYFVRRKACNQFTIHNCCGCNILLTCINLSCRINAFSKG